METKTSVLRWEEPENELAISSIAAVAAMLVTAPLPVSTSRGAISAIWRSESPGRVAIRLRSSTSSPCTGASNFCSATVAPGIDEKLDFTRSASFWSESDPGRGLGAAWASSLASGAALPESKASGGIPPWIGIDSSCRENIAITTASGTESSAILHKRRSITEAF